MIKITKKLIFGLAMVGVFTAGGITINSWLDTATAQESNPNAAITQENGANALHHGEADTDEFKKDHLEMNSKDGSRKNHKATMMDKVDRFVINIDNGIVIEMTSSDPETVALIQEYKANKQDYAAKKDGKDSSKHGWNDKFNLTKSIENIDNGVRITLTSDDPDTVEWLQEKSVSGKGYFGN